MHVSMHNYHFSKTTKGCTLPFKKCLLLAMLGGAVCRIGSQMFSLHQQNCLRFSLSSKQIAVFQPRTRFPLPVLPEVRSSPYCFMMLQSVAMKAIVTPWIQNFNFTTGSWWERWQSCSLNDQGAWPGRINTELWGQAFLCKPQNCLPPHQWRFQHTATSLNNYCVLRGRAKDIQALFVPMYLFFEISTWTLHQSWSWGNSQYSKCYH